MALYLFTKFEEPVKIFSIGHFFVVKRGYNRYLYRIVNVDYLDYVVSGNLNANQQTGYNEISDLIPEEDKMYGFLIGVRGPVKVYVKQPATTLKWGVGGLPGYITQETSPYEAPNPITFTVTLKDTKLLVNVENPLSEVVSYKIRFTGYKYQIQQLAEIKKITSDGVQYAKTDIDFPNDVVKEVLQAWIRGKIPEVTIEGLAPTLK